MTKKQFNLVGSYLYDGDECISHFDDPKHRDEIIDLLNDLHEEKEVFKRQLDDTIELLNKEINSSENAFDGLMKENQRLIKMLDNVANYMQREHMDMPIDEFVIWWNGVATEGLEDCE